MAPLAIEHVLLARQPIVTLEGRTAGYELLFRDERVAVADVEDTAATSRVLVGALADAGLDEVVGSRRAWVNVGTDFLCRFDALPLPVDRVVLEVLERVEPTEAVLERLRALRAEGYLLAADDFVHRPELEPLLDLVHYVKLDVQQHGLTGLAGQIALLAGRDVALVAEKVEDALQFAQARRLGCELFQGWYFCRPEAVHGTRTAGRAGASLAALAQVSAGALDLDALERLVGQDAGLSLRLLRLLNSAAIGVRSEVQTVRQALALLGERPARQWVSLVLLADMAPGAEVLLETAVLRARACQLIGERTRTGRSPEGFFVCGLFSVVEALTGQSRAEALGPLPLEAGLKAALLQGTGPEGAALAEVLRLERGLEAGFTARRAYLDALAWTDRAVAVAA